MLLTIFIINLTAPVGMMPLGLPGMVPPPMLGPGGIPGFPGMAGLPGMPMMGMMAPGLPPMGGPGLLGDMPTLSQLNNMQLNSGLNLDGNNKTQGDRPSEDDDKRRQPDSRRDGK
jgi:hypothetical protein